MRLINCIYLLPFALTLAACSGEDPPSEPVKPDAPVPRAVDAIPGGGTSGGIINDVITVFVQDQDKNPVSGAVVLAQYPGGEISGATDAEGRVDLWDKELKNLIGLHVFADELQYTSVFGINASVMTLRLQPVELPITKLDIVSTTGTVSGWAGLAPNGPETARIATVHAFGQQALLDVEQRPRPGTVLPSNPRGSDYNLLVAGDDPFPMWTDYELTFDARATGLAVYGGTWSENGEPAFDYTHLGYVGGINASSGVTIDSMFLTMDLPLSERVEVSVAASELENQAAFVGVRLPNSGGVIPMIMEKEDASPFVAKAPLLTDSLLEAEYFSAVYFSSEELVQGLPAREILAERAGPEASVFFDVILGPAGTPSAAGRSLAAIPAAGATMHNYGLRDEASGRKYWNVIIAGDLTRSVELPKTPDGLRDPLAGSLNLTVTAQDLGDIDLAATSFEALAGSVRSTSRARALVLF